MTLATALRMVLWAAVSLIVQEAEAKRIALVIGNSRYTAMATLANPVNDATAVAGVLRANNFEVFSYNNVTREKLLDALDAFGNEAENADVAVIYYAGHGLELAGKNIVAPIDMEFSCEQAQPRRVVELDRFFQAIQNVPQQIVLLDACRNDPFPQCPRRGSSGGGFRGVDVAAHGNRVLVASSTLSGRLAEDGPRGGHSPFAGALLAKLQNDPKTPLRSVLDEVAREVALNSRGAQTPEVITRGGAPDTCLSASSCTGSSAAPPAVPPPPPETGASSVCNADLDYQDALRKNTTEAYREFLKRCPNDRRKETVLGLYARLADEEMWQRVSRENTLSGYIQYLVGFPNGIYIEQAKRRRDDLQPPPWRKPAVDLPPPVLPTRPLLLGSSLGRWAVGGASNCGVPSASYVLSLSEGKVIWLNGVGNTDIESIVSSGETEFRTTTLRSIHKSGNGEAPGTSWIYTSIGPDSIRVKPGGRNSFLLERCP